MLSAIHSPHAIFRRQRRNLEVIVEELGGQGCLLLATPLQDRFARALRDGPDTSESLGGRFRLRDLRRQHKSTPLHDLRASFLANGLDTYESLGRLLSRNPHRVVQRLQRRARRRRATPGYKAHVLVKDLRHWLWVACVGVGQGAFWGSSRFVKYLYVLAVSLSGVVGI